MSRDMMNDQELEQLFAAEREAEPLSDALMARILADADERIVARQGAVRTVAPRARRFDWAWVMPGTAMAACLCAGIFIGLSGSVTDTLGFGTGAEQSFAQLLDGDGFDSLFEEEQS
ncbi:MAG: hypothetical protein AAF429_12010 [Pseudomonadota bacterium]